MFGLLGFGLRAAGSYRPPQNPGPPLKQGNGAGGAVIFFLLLGPMVAIFKSSYDGHVSGKAVAVYIVAFIAMIFTGSVIGALYRAHSGAGSGTQLKQRYSGKPVLTSQVMRKRAAELAEEDRSQLTANLFAVPCGDCRALPEVPCAMGIKIPVVLVSREPVMFCHLSRMAAAIARGTVRKEDVTARFGERTAV